MRLSARSLPPALSQGVPDAPLYDAMAVVGSPHSPLELRSAPRSAPRPARVLARLSNLVSTRTAHGLRRLYRPQLGQKLTVAKRRLLE